MGSAQKNYNQSNNFTGCKIFFDNSYTDYSVCLMCIWLNALIVLYTEAIHYI